MEKRTKPSRRRGYTRLSSKHQVTIPASLVGELGLRPGAELRVEASDGRIVLSPLEDLRARRLVAIEETAGSLPGVYEPGELDRMRDEWR